MLGPALGAQPQPRSHYVEGELLVKFRDGPRGEQATLARQRFQHEVRRHFDRLGWQHIRLSPGLSLARALADYHRHPGVLAVEPNYVFRLALAGPGDSPVPNDPQFGQQWALSKIGATNAWALTTGSTNVVVAVLDTGVRYNHEDLAGNMWRNPGEIPGNGIDDDGNGYVDDVFGIDAVNADSDPMDQAVNALMFHGTACASIVGGVGNNRLGVAGVNWSVQLMALRVAAPSNHIASAWVLECIEYVLAMKGRGVNVRVTSNSYGIDDAPSQAVRDSLEALGQADILAVFAAGNNSKDLDSMPDVYPPCFRLPNMINVAASDTLDNMPPFSNYGATNVDLAAPGTNIVVAGGSGGFTTNSYDPFFTGTSASCPYVAGSAALLAAAYPFAAADQIKAALLQSADVLPAFTNRVLSGGRLNLAQALQHPAVSSNAPPHILRPPQDLTVGLGYPASFAVAATGAQPLGYHWRHEGTEFTNTADPRLRLPAVTLAQAGAYSVVLSNAFGRATSAVAVLTVVTRPTILAQPQSLRVLDGTNVSLTVVAAGAAPLALQWQRDGADLGGATNATLAFTNTDWRLSGDYRAVLSNSYGVVMSDVARLTVLTRPQIIVQPRSQTVLVGTDAALSVTVTNTATLPVGFRWRRNTTLFAPFVLHDHTSVTNLPAVQTNSAGTWTVFVTNEGPSGITVILSSNAFLTVVIPPTNLTVLAGSNASFAAMAVGPGPLRYQWQRQGTNLAGATAPTLLLTHVLPADAGVYSVVVTNAAGQPTTFPATLEVRVPAPVLCQPQRLPDGGFRMTVLTVPQLPYAVETSTNLSDWRVQDSFIATNAISPVVDATASDASQRFYRVRTLP
jgi:subtilisin family serine protease